MPSSFPLPLCTSDQTSDDGTDQHVVVLDESHMLGLLARLTVDQINCVDAGRIPPDVTEPDDVVGESVRVDDDLLETFLRSAPGKANHVFGRSTGLRLLPIVDTEESKPNGAKTSEEMLDTSVRRVVDELHSTRVGGSARFEHLDALLNKPLLVLPIDAPDPIRHMLRVGEVELHEQKLGTAERKTEAAKSGWHNLLLWLVVRSENVYGLLAHPPLIISQESLKVKQSQSLSTFATPRG